MGGLDNSIITAIIGSAVTLIGVAVAGTVAVYQITKQARTGLKVDLYREIITGVDRQSEGERQLSTKLRVLSSLNGIWLAPDQFPGPKPSPNVTWIELNELVQKCQVDAADLMITIERWQIVDPRIDIFRMAFGVALREIRATWGPLSQSASAVLAVMPGGPVPQDPPRDMLERLLSESLNLLRAAAKLSAWVSDFQLEVQGLMLSDLFRNRLTHRIPLDPEYFVIRLDRFAAIKDYFENRTTWGLEQQVINARIKEQVAARFPAFQGP